MTRVVVPVAANGSDPVRFEDRSIEKRIQAFEAATLAAANAAVPAGPRSATDDPPSSAGAAGREHLGRAMIAVPRRWMTLLAAAVVVAIAAAAAAGFWVGWLASQASARQAPAIIHGRDGSGRR